MPRAPHPRYPDEPDPIVIGGPLRPLEPRSFADDDDGVGPIRLDPTPVLDEPVITPPPTARRRQRLPIGPALAAGALAGLVIGGGVGLWLRQDQADAPKPPMVAVLTPAPVQPAPPGVDSTPMRPALGPSTEPATPPVAAGPTAPADGLNLDNLARSLSPPATPSPQPPPRAAEARPAPVQTAAAPPPPPQVAPPPSAVAIPRPSEVARISGEPAPRPPVASPAATAPDPEMIYADRRLNQAYDYAMAKAADRDGLHDEQARWLAARDRLTGGRDSYMAMTRDRTNELYIRGKRDHRRR